MADSKSYENMLREIREKANSPDAGLGEVRKRIDEVAKLRAANEALVLKKSQEIAALNKILEGQREAQKRMNHPLRNAADNAQNKYITQLLNDMNQLKNQVVKLQENSVRQELNQAKATILALKEELLNAKAENIALRERLLGTSSK